MQFGNPERISGKLSENERALVEENRLLEIELEARKRESLEDGLELWDKQIKSGVDSLTGVFRREVFEKEFKEELEVIRSKEKPKRPGDIEKLSIIFVDLDHFKNINDIYGHSTGDDVLRGIGAFLTSMVRKTDLVARVGGEEFVIMLRGADKEFATKEAGLIQSKIKEIKFTNPEIKMSASFGVASSEDSDDPGELYDFADQSVYKAKGTRDCVVTYVKS